MSLQDEVLKVVSRVIKVPEHALSSDAGLGIVSGWDSLNHTTLVVELEDAFDVAFDFDELDRIVTVTAIVECCRQRGGGMNRVLHRLRAFPSMLVARASARIHEGVGPARSHRPLLSDAGGH